MFDNEKKKMKTTTKCKFVYTKSCGTYVAGDSCSNEVDEFDKAVKAAGYCSTRHMQLHTAKLRNEVSIKHKPAENSLKSLEILQNKQEVISKAKSDGCNGNDSSISPNPNGNVLVGVENGGESVSTWPQIVSDEIKFGCISEFLAVTDKKKLFEISCILCGENVRKNDALWIGVSELEKHQKLLEYDPVKKSECDRRYHEKVKDSLFNYSSQFSALNGMVLNRAAMDSKRNQNEDNDVVPICLSCDVALRKKKLPRFSLANGFFVGETPKELRGLTMPEEMFISRYRSWICVLKLMGYNDKSTSGNLRYGFKGNCITFPQNPGKALKCILPSSPEDIASTILCVFVGSVKPSRDQLKNYNMLKVRRSVVRDALMWLKVNNLQYKDIEIDEDNLSRLPEDGVPEELLASFDFVEDKDHNASAEQEGYDNIERGVDELLHDVLEPTGVVDINAMGVKHGDQVSNILESVTGERSSRSFSDNENGFEDYNSGNVFYYPHEKDPVVEFNNPDLLPCSFPTLFPYGIGGFENQRLKVDFQRYLNHLLMLQDDRFCTHYSFMFVCFNMLQRRKACMRARMVFRQPVFRNVAEVVNSLSKDELCCEIQRSQNMLGGNMCEEDGHANNVSNNSIGTIYRQLRIIGGKVPGSQFSKACMRNQIRGLNIMFGSPDLYITINPADLYNPLVLLFAGNDVGSVIDNRSLDQLYPMHIRKKICARNPVAVARFFEVWVEALITCIIGWGREEGGVFGKLEAFYAVIESQLRGALHTHGVYYLDGALSIDEIKARISDTEFSKRFIAYLSDIIKCDFKDLEDLISFNTQPLEKAGMAGNDASTSDEMDEGKADIPSDEDDVSWRPPEPPCRNEYSDVNEYEDAFVQYIEDYAKDLLQMLKTVQIHKHTGTCYKYGHIECRFRLPAEKVEEAIIEVGTGSIKLRRLHQMVNQYNEILSSCARCNTDVKYVGMNGNQSLAVMYYITSYITKGGLTTHNANALVKSAMAKILSKEENTEGTTTGLSDNHLEKARSRLLRCLISITGQQELSAAEVASLILSVGDGGDHFSSHKFVNVMLGGLDHYFLKMNCDEDRVGHDGSGSQKDSSFAEDFSIYFDENDEKYCLVNDRLDYQLRDDQLQEVCLYDYKSQYTKIKICSEKQRLRKKSSRKRKRKASVVNDTEDIFDDDCSVEDEENEVEEGIDDVDSFVVKANAYSGIGRKPYTRYLLKDPHPQRTTYCVRILGDIKVPVLLGKTIPSRADTEEEEYYGRIMLALFKPWRKIGDLKGNSITWKNAFDNWFNASQIEGGPSNRIRRYIQNIEHLHKSAEEARLNRIERKTLDRKQQINGENEEDESNMLSPSQNVMDIGVNEQIDDSDLISTVINTPSRGELKTMEWVNNGLAACENACAFENISTTCSSSIGATQNDDDIEEHIVDMSKFVDDGEKYIVDMYKEDLKKQREDVIKSRRMATIDTQRNTDEIRGSSQSLSQRDSSGVVNSKQRHSVEPQMVERVLRTPEQVAQKHGLRGRQRVAFKIICKHLQDTVAALRNCVLGQHCELPDQLLMCLLGRGGTGKTRTLNAVVEYFHEMGVDCYLRLGAFTGSAASIINASTLHTLLKKKGKSKKSDGSDDNLNKGILLLLETDWGNVRYFIIDEISMVGCRFLHEIHATLSQAKKDLDRSVPFGGVNMIMCGDFKQFAPIADIALFEDLDSHKAPPGCPLTQKLINSYTGRVLWNMVNKCVILTHVHRTSDIRLLRILDNIRNCTVTEEDYQILLARVAGPKNNINLGDRKWRNATWIVSRNMLRSEINTRLMIRNARSKGVPISVSEAEDSMKINGKSSKEIPKFLVDKIKGLSDDKTENLTKTLQVFPGCSVMITQNYATELNIVNGTIGTFLGFVKNFNSKTNAVPMYALIKVPNPRHKPLPGLPADVIPVFPVEKTFSVKCSIAGSDMTFSISRMQVPLVLCNCITDIKSQGKSLKRIIVDLSPAPYSKACFLSLAAYVALSRCNGTLEDIVILRWFPKSVLNAKQPQALLDELNRLQQLSDETERKFYIVDEREEKDYVGEEEKHNDSTELL